MTRRASTKGLVRSAITAPVAVLGTLAASLTAAPAHAQAPATVSLAAYPTANTALNLNALRSAAPAVSARSVAPLSTKTPATHTVVRGDTVYAIAMKHGLTVSAILTANGIGSNALIFPGQKLILPGRTATVSPPKPAAGNSGPMTHTVVRGDTVFAIAKKYGSTITAILTANAIGSNALIFPGQKLVIPGGTATSSPPSGSSQTTQPSAPASSPSGTTYTVVRGDTVFAIAQRFGSTVSTILTANGIPSNAIIYIGQKLVIPGGTGTSGTTAGVASGQKYADLDAEQIANATLIINIGRELGVPERGIAIALATAMVESWIRNLNWGDRDSLGLFQQRPSTGWGTAAQIMDASRSIRVFYGGPNDPNGSKTRGLLDIPGWESLGFSQAAQRVQISAFPDRYGQWELAAYRWLELYG